MSSATWAPAVGPGVTLVVFVAISLPLPVIAIALRLWSRRLIRKSLEFNDYSVIVGTILAIANSGVTLGAVYYGGVGRHVEEILTEYPLLYKPLMKMTLTLALTWTLANTAVKLSILHLYHVIFAHPKFQWGCYAVMGLTVAYCVSNCLQNLLLCRPIQYNWDKNIHGVCTPSYYPYVSSASINMGLDVIIFLLPLPMLWSLQMRSGRKIALSFIFGIGILICSISAVRIHAIATMNYDDFSYTVVPDGIYSALEPCLGICSACFPVSRPALTKILGFIKGNKRKESPSLLHESGFNPSSYYGGMRTSVSAAKRFQRIENASKDVHPLQITAEFELETHEEHASVI